MLHRNNRVEPLTEVAEPMSDTCAAWRTQNIGHLLFAATGRCVRDKLDVVHRDGFEAISDAQLTLFLHLDPAGTRLTTLAARAGLTKQSMIELVDKAHALALVDRRPDPDDRRAKIVALTGLGSRALATLHEGIASAEREVARVVGGGFPARDEAHARRVCRNACFPGRCTA